MATKCGEIFWDHKKGYGYVMFDPTFRREDPIVCLDAIGDWTTGMAHEYNDHIKRSRQKFDTLRRQARRVRKKTMTKQER